MWSSARRSSGDASRPPSWHISAPQPRHDHQAAYYAAMTNDGDIAVSQAESPDSGLDEFRALVRAAFERALDSGRPDWQEMTAAVLKNRLLDMTNRQFSESRYGVSSFIRLVRLVPDLLEIVDDKPPVQLRINASVFGQSVPREPSNRLRTSSTAGDYVTPTDADWQKVRVRQDLWRAAIDYRSASVYVIDSHTGIARRQGKDDSELPVVPTISAEIVDSWRRQFIESLAEPSKGEYVGEMEAWASRRGRQSDLPHPVRGLWAEFMKRKVVGILLDWYRSNGIPVPSDMLSTPQKQSARPSGAVDEVVRTQQLRELIIRAIRAMSYEELVKISLPASVLLRASEK